MLRGVCFRKHLENPPLLGEKQVFVVGISVTVVGLVLVAGRRRASEGQHVESVLGGLARPVQPIGTSQRSPNEAPNTLAMQWHVHSSVDVLHITAMND